MFNHSNSVFENDLEPTEFYLSPNYPNPFNEKTIIKYCIAYKTRVQLTVYDSEGNVIEKLVDEKKQPGTYEVNFTIDHCKEFRAQNSETFYYRLEAGEYKSEKKMQIYK